VAGLSPAELRQVVTAPPSIATRAVTGPVAEQVTVAGRKVWRVRIPGHFPVRDARVVVIVGTRQVGQGIVASNLGSLTAVSPDGTGLVSGAPVRFQWEGTRATSAGRLEVVR
jgi:hypothetical protein